MIRESRPVLLRYGVAAGASAAAFLTALLARPLPDGSNSLVFLAAVTISAWHGGLGPGLIPTVVGILAITSSGTLHESLAITQLHTPAGALLYILVAVLTTALQARLRRAHQRADAARAMAARRSGRLRALQDAALTIAAPVSAEPAAVAALLTRIIDGAVASVGGCDGSFVLADDRAWAGLVPGTASGEGPVWLAPSGQLERAPLRPGGATARVLAGGPAVVVPDTLAPPARDAYEALARDGVRSFAVVPLRAGGRVLGALSVSFANHGAALEETHETLELFAAHAAAALERVRWADETARQAAALAQREAEAAGWRELDRMKDEFLLTISHELRTPLTVIYGDAARLEARARALDPAAVQASAARIRSSSDRLTRLVRDLLDFARIDQGEIQVRPQPVDLAPLLHEVAAAWRREPMGERLVCDLPASLPAVADPQRVAQVVSNLIVNALKYAPDGPVLLRARLVGGGSTVRVVVADEGPGIMPGEQSRVWEKFFRGAGVAGLNRVPGAGIGLSVVKALIEAQDGRVGLDSAPGQGCCFWFELPATPAAEAAPAEPVALPAAASGVVGGMAPDSTPDAKPDPAPHSGPATTPARYPGPLRRLQPVAG